MNATYLTPHNTTSFGQNYAVDNQGLLGYVLGLVAFVIVMSGCSLLWQLRAFRAARSRHQLGSSSIPHRMSVEEAKARKQFVKSTLPHRRLTKEEAQRTIHDPNSPINSKDLERQNHSLTPEKLLLRTISSSSDDPESLDPTDTPQLPLCSICLGRFSVGDQISWSTNPHCSHQYHRDCIYSWLLKHADCPVCRQTFLPQERSSFTPGNSATAATLETHGFPRLHRPSLEPLMPFAAIAVVMTRHRTLIPRRQAQEQQQADLQTADEEQPQSISERQTRTTVGESPNQSQVAIDEEQAQDVEQIQVVVESRPTMIYEETSQFDEENPQVVPVVQPPMVDEGQPQAFDKHQPQNGVEEEVSQETCDGEQVQMNFSELSHTEIRSLDAVSRDLPMIMSNENLKQRNLRHN